MSANGLSVQRDFITLFMPRRPSDEEMRIMTALFGLPVFVVYKHKDLTAFDIAFSGYKRVYRIHTTITDETKMLERVNLVAHDIKQRTPSLINGWYTNE